MNRVVALLRAVNVGGRKVSMADLRTMLGSLGFSTPRTILQTGNLIFESDAPPDSALETRLEKAIEQRFELRTEVMARDTQEWSVAIAANPFSDAARDDPAHLLLMALKTSPGAGAIEALRAAIRGRERVELKGHHLYLVYPDGIGNSKLTISIVERALGVRGTTRNWNTVLKLAEV